MSGGYFDYKQYQINDLIDEMEHIVQNCDMEPALDKNGYNTCDNNSLKPYVKDTERFKKEVIKVKKYLELSKIYVQRIDWFLSGDDGEDTFYKRLDDEMKERDI